MAFTRVALFLALVALWTDSSHSSAVFRHPLKRFTMYQGRRAHWGHPRPERNSIYGQRRVINGRIHRSRKNSNLLQVLVTRDELLDPRIEAIAREARRELIRQQRLMRDSTQKFREEIQNRTDSGEFEWDSWGDWIEGATKVAPQSTRNKEEREWRRGDYGVITGLKKRADLNSMGAVVVRGKNAEGRITVQLVDTKHWREKRKFVQVYSRHLAPTVRCVKLERLMRWLEDQRGFTKGVRIGEAAFSAEGKGLVAARDAEAGDTLIHLPESCLLRTLDKTLPAAYLGAILDAEEEMVAARQGLRLAYERKLGNESFWLPYLQTLPPVPQGVPILWNREEVMMMDIAKVTQEVIQSNSTLLAAAGRVHIDHDILRWGAATATSRTLDLSLRGTFFGPLIDLCRHSFTPNAEVQLENGYLTLLATKDIAEGEPVYINYGNEKNDKYLLNYGRFVPEENPHETVNILFNSTQMFAMSRMGARTEKLQGALEAEIATFEPCEYRSNLMGYYGLIEGREIAIANSKGVDDDFRSGRMRCLITDRELPRVEDYKDKLPNMDMEWISAHAIRVLYAHLLTEHQNSEEEDAAILRRQDERELSTAEVLAIKFRLQKKKIIRRAYLQVTDDITKMKKCKLTKSSNDDGSDDVEIEIKQR